MNRDEVQVIHGPPVIQITHSAMAKLRAFVQMCDYEISGLGTIREQNGKQVVTDVFLLDQWNYHAFTELKPEAVARFLVDLVRSGRDPAEVKFWWHSHVDMDVFWSEIDDYTARGFHNGYMWSMVLNRRGEYRCRLDLSEPLRLTIDRAELQVLAPAPGEELPSPEVLRAEIDRHIEIFRDESLDRYR